MKKIIFLFALMLSVTCANAADPVKKWGQLQVVGNQLCDKDGNAVVLRGISLGWHNLWPRFYNKKTVKILENEYVPQWVFR